jgi:hypothetical protein
MRNVFAHARQVEHVTRSALDRFLRDTAEATDVDPTPEDPPRARRVARRGAAMPAATLTGSRRRFRRGGRGPTRSATFLDLLSTGVESRPSRPSPDRAARALRRMGRRPVPPAGPVPPVLGRRAPARNARGVAVLLEDGASRDLLVAGRGHHGPRRPPRRAARHRRRRPGHVVQAPGTFRGRSGVGCRRRRASLDFLSPSICC